MDRLAGENPMLLTPPPSRSEVTKLSEDVAALKAHAQHARSADGVEDRLRSLAETVQNLPTSLSRDATSDAVKQLSETVLGELRRRDAAPVAARPDVDEKLALRFERLERALENAVAQRPARAPEMKLAGEEMRHLRESTSRDAAADEVKNLREKFLEFQVAANAPRDDRDAVARNLEAQLAKHTSAVTEAIRATSRSDGARDDLKSLQLDFRALQDTVARGLEDARRERRAVHEAPAPASESPRLKALERSIADIATGLKDDMARLRESTARDHAAGALASLSEKVSALQSRRPEEPASTVARNLPPVGADHVRDAARARDGLRPLVDRRRRAEALALS